MPQVTWKEGEVKIEEEFYVAVTHGAIEDTLETPIVVAKVCMDKWKK